MKRKKKDKKGQRRRGKAEKERKKEKKAEKERKKEEKTGKKTEKTEKKARGVMGATSMDTQPIQILEHIVILGNTPRKN